MKIYAVCQSGLGTSFMVEMNVKQILENAGVDMDNFQVDHADLGSISADMADYFFIEHTLEGSLSNIPKEKLVPLQAIIDIDETKQQVYSILDENNIEHN
ncbi:MAG: PTS sugar transporter subunit IIB [Micrococcaceae bacterium]